MEFTNVMKSLHMIMCVVYVCTYSSVEGTCSDCIICLDSGITPTEALRFDSEDCPSPCSAEYSILQQIDYMFRSGQPVPCNAECNSCVISAHKPDKQHCSIEKLDKPYLEGLYDGVFFNSAFNYNQHALRPETQFSGRGRRGSPYSDNASVETGCSINCPIERRLERYTSDMVDPVTGKHWYGVWFMNSGASPSYQFYEVVNCASRASNRSCSQINSQRTMLVTTIKPNPKDGHTYKLFFNFGFVSNIRFYGVEIAAHCFERAL